MKLLSTYLEGIEEGEVIPSIKGIIQSVKVNEETGTQTVTIAAEDGSIKIVAKDKGGQVIDPVVGNILGASSTSKGKSLQQGLMYKKNKTSGLFYILATMGAIYSQVSVTESEPVEEEAMTAADTSIDGIALDRLYIFKRASKIVAEFNAGDHGCTFPPEKCAELATSIHIEIKGRTTIRPTDKQLERKQIHKKSFEEKKEGKAPVKEPKKSNDEWRNALHPVSGERIGDISIEKMATQFLPWYFRTDPATLKPAVAELHRVFGEAMVGLKLTPQMVLEKYIMHYAQEYSPTSAKRRDKSMVEFAHGLHEGKHTKNNIIEGSVTETEARNVLKSFGHIWKEIVEKGD